MTATIVRTVLKNAVVVTIPRRESGTPTYIPTAVFKVEVTDKSGTTKYSVMCDENLSDTARDVVRKGDIGDFYGSFSDDSPTTIIVDYISLNDHI